MYDIDWTSYAKCRGQDTNIFFPEECNKECAKEAKRMCWGCKAKDDCLNYAIIHKVTDGIWGGLCARDRKKIAILEPWRHDGKESKPCLVGQKPPKYNGNNIGIKMGRIAI